MPKAYHVYVLKNSNDRYYIGITEDIAGRLAQHNAGESPCTQFQKSDGPRCRTFCLAKKSS